MNLTQEMIDGIDFYISIQDALMSIEAHKLYESDEIGILIVYDETRKKHVFAALHNCGNEKNKLFVYTTKMFLRDLMVFTENIGYLDRGFRTDFTIELSFTFLEI